VKGGKEGSALTNPSGKLIILPQKRKDYFHGEKGEGR
jgi:hypothetical protein